MRKHKMLSCQSVTNLLYISKAKKKKKKKPI